MMAYILARMHGSKGRCYSRMDMIDAPHVTMQIHAKRVTIMPKDIQLARRIRGERP